MLQVSELSAGAAALSASAEDPSAAGRTADKDNDGQSSAEAAAAHERRRVIRTLRKAFRRADSDGNGVLDVPEVSSSAVVVITVCCTVQLIDECYTVCCSSSTLKQLLPMFVAICALAHVTSER
jgi:hypothetical protein